MLLSAYRDSLEEPSVGPRSTSTEPRLRSGSGRDWQVLVSRLDGPFFEQRIHRIRDALGKTLSWFGRESYGRVVGWIATKRNPLEVIRAERLINTNSLVVAQRVEDGQDVASRTASQQAVENRARIQFAHSQSAPLR